MRILTGLLFALTWHSLTDSGHAQPRPVVFDNFADRVLSDVDLLDLAVGRFNGDDQLDFAVVTVGGEVLLVRSDGEGGYDRVEVNNPGIARAVTFGDIDGDGDLDLVYAEDGQVTSRLGFANGQLGLPAFSGGPADPSGHLELVDLDANGDLDIVIASDDGTTADDLLFGLLGDGLGNFGSIQSYPVGNEPRAVRTGFLDGDSFPEVFVLDRDDEVWIYRGVGDGSLAIQSTVDGGSFLRDLRVADFNEDLQDDLLTAGSSPRLFLGDGTGGFLPEYDPGTAGSWIATGDFDEDGHLDVVSNGLIALGDGTGFFPLGAVFTRETFGTLVEQGDVDGDGHADLIVGEVGCTGGVAVPGLGTGFLGVYRGDGEGGFGTSPVLGTGPFSFDRLSADFNADGHLDYYAGDEFEHRIYLGDGTGRLERTGTFEEFMDNGPGLFGDFNGDGLPDFCATGQVSERIFVRLGNPDGSFDPAIVRSLGGARGSVLAADFDDDGNLDVAVKRTQDRVAIMRGRGDGRLRTPINLTEGLLFKPRPVATADFDEDGVLDLVVSRASSGVGPENRISVMRGQGNGTFAVQANLPISGAIDVVDFNGDGHFDVLVGQEDGIDIFEGTGTGQFEAARRLISDVEADGQLTVVDMNGDGDLDLVAGKVPQPITIVYGVGGGNVGGSRIVCTSSFGHGFVVGDYDEDGLPDLVLGRSTLEPLLNRTRFFASREGTVNGAAGSVEPVLFVNDSRGFGRERVVTLSPADPFELRIDRAPSGGNKFAIYAWSARLLSSRSVSDPGFGIGFTSMPTPFNAPRPAEAPVAIWKTIQGFEQFFGEATFGSSPAPSVLVDQPMLGIQGEFFVQGFLLDSQSPQGRLAVTNGVLIISE